MNSKLKILTALTAITILSGLATASQAELTIFPQESSTNIDSFTSYEVEVENIGPVDDVYEMQHNYPGEISIAPTKVELESGESETVNVWFNPRQDRVEGTYDFRIDAKSRADGKTYSTTGTVNVIHDYRTDIQVNPQSSTVCRGERAEYTVEVTNEGIQDDEIKVETERGELSEERFTLSPDETRTVTLEVSSEQETEESFDVKASSTRVSYSSDQERISFTSETCFDSEVEVNPDSQRTAAFTETNYSVVLENQGTRADEFTLSTSKGDLSQETVNLPAESTEELELSVTPEELGTHQITVEASGESESSKTVELEAYNGMESDVSVEDRTVCSGEDLETQATIENTGEASERFELSTDFGELSTGEVGLDQGESEEVALEAAEVEEGEHTVTVESEAQTFGEPVSTGEAVVNAENCWDVSMDVIPEVASAGENKSTIYEIRLENTGTRENTYRLEHEGPDWISIRPEELTVSPGQTESSYMYVGVPFEKRGEVEITAIAEGEQARASQTVQLLIDDEVEEAIRSRTGEWVGRFTDSVPSLDLELSDNVVRGTVAILLGVAITAFIVLREW